MKITLLRNLGAGLVAELSLEFAGKDKQPIYVAGSVHDVETAVGERLIKLGLAEGPTDGGRHMRGIGDAPKVRGVGETKPAASDK